MTSYYGHYKNDQHPIAVQIWGHRLRIGQHWMEYMLEFLSVLSGFDYRLGQGLPERHGQENYLSEYRVPTRLGLRRFVFYDEHEKTRDTRDTRATVELRQSLCRLMPDTGHPTDDKLIEQVRSLLRSFSAVEEERSWYAKTLFPVHQEFLLWEALRKGSTVREYKHTAEHLELYQLDQGVEFLARNFFARGGELYYLIVSAGTEGNPEQRTRICDRLRALLTERNQSLGRIAQAIDTTWTQLSGCENGAVTGTLGWIYDPSCALYKQIAEDLDTFLANDLDSLECLELLAHLIGFHIITYIYHRSHPASNPEGHTSGSCLEACRPLILVDLLGEQDGGIVRHQSASLLREQDDLQLRQAREQIAQNVQAWAAQEPDLSRLRQHVEDEARAFFFNGQKKAMAKFDAAVCVDESCRPAAAPDRASLIHSYTEALFEALSGEFRKNFLGIHRKIGRAIGLIAPRKGTHMRFVLGDTLLKTLVLAMLGEGKNLPFGAFLEQLHQRYGIIVGPGEARTADLLARLRINEEYYARNRDALRARMHRAGLLTQYSDATALVRRRQ